MDGFHGIFLGTRGSTPVEGTAYQQYGTGTACILLEAGDTCVILDAGTGLLSLPSFLPKGVDTLHILLSHPHLDHILGLPVNPILFNPAFTVHIYGARWHGLSLREQLETLMRPPLWPVGLGVFGAKMLYHDLVDDMFFIEDVKVQTATANHPGGCLMYRLQYKESHLVYLTDYEDTPDFHKNTIEFCRDCDILICDGQYSPEIIQRCSGYGHSSWMDAGRIANEAQVGRLFIFHHNPTSTNDMLDNAQQEVRKIFPFTGFAKRGERFRL